MVCHTTQKIYVICVGLQRYLRDSGWPGISFLNHYNRKEYWSLKQWKQDVELNSQGRTREQPEPITEDYEQLLWDKTVFTDCWKLKISDFKFGVDNNRKYVLYRRRYKRMVASGFYRKCEQLKDIRHHQDTNDPRCYYNILQKYFFT